MNHIAHICYSTIAYWNYSELITLPAWIGAICPQIVHINKPMCNVFCYTLFLSCYLIFCSQKITQKKTLVNSSNNLMVHFVTYIKVTYFHVLIVYAAMHYIWPSAQVNNSHVLSYNWTLHALLVIIIALHRELLYLCTHRHIRTSLLYTSCMY